MASPRPWTVLHPGPLTARRDGVWTVDDDVPGLPGATRRMTVVRRADGSLLFFNAVPVPDETLAQLRALGRPAQLVLPNHLHALDAASFIARLQVDAYAPAPGVPLLAARGVTARPIDALATEPGLSVVTVDGFSTGEVALVFDDTLVVADLVTNAPHGPGLMGLAMRLVGFTGPTPKLPRPVRARVMKDGAAVKAVLRRLAERPLRRLIPSHGALVEGDVPAVLRQVADSW